MAAPRKFEAGFTFYSVVFTGDEMPNGYRADAVYSLLNEHYWKLLNKAQFRPLDFDYQKSLKPAAHGFYELVSFPIYGCLSRSQSEATAQFRAAVAVNQQLVLLYWRIGTEILVRQRRLDGGRG